jgi:hypothetical protein
MEVQVPTAPARLHAWHVPLHAALQHTPSTHFPELQVLPAVHAAPLASLAAHTPALQ